MCARCAARRVPPGSSRPRHRAPRSVTVGDRSSVGRARVCLAIPSPAPFWCGPTAEAYRHSRPQVELRLRRRLAPLRVESCRSPSPSTPRTAVGSAESSLPTIRPRPSGARAAGRGLSGHGASPGVRLPRSRCPTASHCRRAAAARLSLQHDQPWNSEPGAEPHSSSACRTSDAAARVAAAGLPPVTRTTPSALSHPRTPPFPAAPGSTRVGYRGRPGSNPPLIPGAPRIRPPHPTSATRVALTATQPQEGEQ